MRRILLSTAKILISGALLYFSLRKVNLHDLASRIQVESLGWLGLEIDAEANSRHAETIHSATSRIDALVIPTDEEQVIADDALALFKHP